MEGKIKEILDGEGGGEQWMRELEGRRKREKEERAGEEIG